MNFNNSEILISTNADQYQTLKNIDRIADKSSTHPFITSSIEKFQLKDDFESLQKVLKAVFNLATFFPDPSGHQYIRSVNRILKDRVANCVDYTVFISAFLRAMEVDHIIRMVSFDPDNKLNYAHIYPLSLNGIALDAVFGQDQDGAESLKSQDERKEYFHKQVPFMGYFDKIIKA